ncbi:MAG: HIT domain-containing protein [Neisseria sp.]|nr:HIT domain-containing protein [Neisseria sp.]
MTDCPLCRAQHPPEDILLENSKVRVIAVHDEDGAPAFCRVIWREHIAEMTDLHHAERQILMETVFRLEAAMRKVFRPAKINLASLGNVVPHLHWHVIARFTEDSRFPAPIWAPPQRATDLRLPQDWPRQLQQLLTTDN